MNNSRSRRWYAVSLGILGIALVVVGVHVAPGWATSPDQIKVNRGTNIAATVSPDFASIVFDLGGNTVTGQTVRVPDGVTLTFVNGTFVGGSHAVRT